MASPSRTRTRKTAQVKAKAEEVTQDEVDLAAAQENEAYLQSQLAYLQQRVAMLRVEINRKNKEIAAFKAAQESTG